MKGVSKVTAAIGLAIGLAVMGGSVVGGIALANMHRSDHGPTISDTGDDEDATAPASDEDAEASETDDQVDSDGTYDESDDATADDAADDPEPDDAMASDPAHPDPSPMPMPTSGPDDD